MFLIDVDSQAISCCNVIGLDIENIEIGDFVLAEDTVTGEQNYKAVLKVFVSQTNKQVHVKTVDSDSETTINTTDNHPFYVEGKGWVPAIELEAGDVLRTADGDVERVSKVDIEYLDEAVLIYNLEIEGYHTYFVSDESVLVHNGCGTDDGDSGYRVDDSRRNHILEGEGSTDPGHGPNRGFTEGAFPDTWTDEQAILSIEDVANNPNSTWKQSTGPGVGNAPVTIGGPDVNAPTMTNKGTPVRFIVKGRNHGLNITVIVEPNGAGIITGYSNGK